MLEVKNLSVSYGENHVFSNVDVSFSPGKITGIIGPNGAGKSTLVKGMLELIRVQQGTTTTYNGKPLHQQKKKVAYVEQRKDLDTSFPINVFELVLTGTYGSLGLFRTPGKKEREKVQAALEQVGLTDFSYRQIGQLSGGQLQRSFVARAIVQEAEVIILDEPFVGIDLQSETAIMEILKKWKAAGKIILVIHHDLNKVYQYFDDLVIMNHGIVAAGPTSEVYQPQYMEKAFSPDLSQVLFSRKGGSAE